ncbi:hypothetical protein [Halofilum ochraceum]|uniref:hypothetical protein n=1 Tax=Halofilum ochraceum TaxID=1611323 RepID=UPI00111304F5|nr:hypothetical protein [Halofilum ochraceum]
MKKAVPKGGFFYVWGARWLRFEPAVRRIGRTADPDADQREAPEGWPPWMAAVYLSGAPYMKEAADQAAFL